MQRQNTTAFLFCVAWFWAVHVSKFVVAVMAILELASFAPPYKVAIAVLLEVVFFIFDVVVLIYVSTAAGATPSRIKPSKITPAMPSLDPEPVPKAELKPEDNDCIKTGPGPEPEPKPKPEPESAKPAPVVPYKKPAPAPAPAQETPEEPVKEAEEKEPTPAPDKEPEPEPKPEEPEPEPEHDPKPESTSAPTPEPAPAPAPTPAPAPAPAPAPVPAPAPRLYVPPTPATVEVGGGETPASHWLDITGISCDDLVSGTDKGSVGDPYVVFTVGPIVGRTATVGNTLSPSWASRGAPSLDLSEQKVTTPFTVHATFFDDDKTTADDPIGSAEFVVSRNGDGRVDDLAVAPQGKMTIVWELSDKPPTEGFTINTAESHAIMGRLEANRGN